MEQTRDSKGRFRRSYLIWGLLIIIAVLGFTVWNMQSYLLEYEAPIIQTIGNDQIFYETKVETLKQDVLDRLAKCETDGTEDPDGAIIFDSNEHPSIGRYQFQRKTVRHYIKEYEGRDITNSEAIAIAIDPVKASSLVSKIIFENGVDPALDWHTCSRKLGLSKEVEILNKLTK